MKKAMLVTVSLTTRVVVDEDAKEHDILEKARENFVPKLYFELNENLEGIVPDTECPYSSDTDGK
jgi:hypothetical protein